MNYEQLKYNLKINIPDSELDKCFIYPNNDNPNKEIYGLACLGDSVLGYITMRYLYEKFPNSSKQELTKYKESIVSNSVLSQIAEKLGFRKVLDVGTIGSINNTMLANVFEAFCGVCELNNNQKELEAIIKDIIDEVFELHDKFKSFSLDKMKLDFEEAGYKINSNECVDSNDNKKLVRLKIEVEDSKENFEEKGETDQKAEQNAFYKAYCTLMLKKHFKTLN